MSENKVMECTEQRKLDGVNASICNKFPSQILGQRAMFTGWKVNYDFQAWLNNEVVTLLDDTVRAQAVVLHDDGMLFVDSTGSKGFLRKGSVIPEGTLGKLVSSAPHEALLQRAREMERELVELARQRRGKIR